jgi:hypothetical protein
VRPVRVVVIGILAQDQLQVPFAVISIRSGHSRRALAIHRSPDRGTGAPGRPYRGLDDPRPGRGETASNAAVNLASRSRTRNLKASAWSSRFIRRLRACWATHSPVGWAVMPAR